jgi:hypothetical protein
MLCARDLCRKQRCRLEATDRSSARVWAELHEKPPTAAGVAAKSMMANAKALEGM